MEISLYHNKSLNNVLNKTIELVQTFNNIKLLDTLNVLNPMIRLSTTAIPTNANYVYIPTLSRYYFIVGSTIITNNQIELQLKCDVLMSFKDIINNIDVVAIRSSNKANKLLPDSIPVLAKRNVIYKVLSGGAHDIGAFGSEFCKADQPHYLLTVLNGAHEEAGATTLELLEVNGANVRIAWDEISGVSTYWIYRKAPGALDFEIIEQNPIGTQYTDTVSVTGTFQYKVAGVIDGTPGADSNIISADVSEV